MRFTWSPFTLTQASFLLMFVIQIPKFALPPISCVVLLALHSHRLYGGLYWPLLVGSGILISFVGPADLARETARSFPWIPEGHRRVIRVLRGERPLPCGSIRRHDTRAQ